MSDKIFKVDRDMLIYAIKYALPRMSYSSSVVTDNIKSNIENISTNDIELYIKTIKEFEDYGMEMDKIHWLNFIKYLDCELEKRI